MIAVPEGSVADLLRRARQAGPERIAVIHEDRRLSFRELDDRSSSLATHLAGMGIRKTDRVAVALPNGPDLAVALFGILKAGGVVVPVNPSSRPHEIRFVWEDSSPRAVVAGPGVPTGLAGIGPVIRAGAPGRGEVELAELTRGPGGDPAVPVDPGEDLAALPYSSGTTGTSKGVMLTHSNLLANVRQFHEALPCGPGDRFLVHLPLHHSYGMTVALLGGIGAAARLVMVHPFHPGRVLEQMERHRATCLHTVPPALRALGRWQDLERFDLSSLRYVKSGAAPLDPEVARTFTRRTGVPVIQGYGLTEASPLTHCDDPAGPRPETIGPPVAGTDHRFVDPGTGEDVPAGAAGELVVRGPQVMRGYWRRPAETKQALAGGWLRTGDIAVLEPDGRVRIVGRIKEMIKVRGFAVAPAEIEALILRCPGVADCAVVGRPDPSWGEVPEAFIVRANGGPTAEEVVRHVASHAESHKRVRAVRFVPVIPRSPSGKILRHLLPGGS